MLLTLMYHQINDPTSSKSLDIFQQHLLYLYQTFNIVVPGDKLATNKLNVCLTFDDAYFDFYHCVFPLLKKYSIKAVLAIPTAWILDSTDKHPKKRLELKYPGIMEPKWLKTHAPFCTFLEIKEMCDSGLVVPAAHGHYHANLELPVSDELLAEEIIEPKKILEQQLQSDISTFIFPYGRSNENSRKLVHANYKHVFRIGAATNKSFDDKILYRFDADHIWKHNIEIDKKFLRKLKFKYWINKIRQY